MKKLFNTWLTLQCHLVSGCTQGTVLSGVPGSGSYYQTASWPDSSPHLNLLAAGAATLAENRCLIRKADHIQEDTGQPCDVITAPLYFDNQIQGAVAITVASGSPVRQQLVREQLRAGAVWLEALSKQESTSSNEELITLVELVGSSLEYGNFQEAATAVVTGLASNFACERVSIGFRKGQDIRVFAVSHSAHFDRRSGVISAIKGAMYEAFDQKETIVYPPLNSKTPQIVVAHTTLCKDFGVERVCTIPLLYKDTVVGALLLEKSEASPFNDRNIQQCEQIAELIGPALESRRRDDVWLPGRLLDPLFTFLIKLFGPQHLKLKLATAFSLLLLAALFVIPSDFRISCNSVLEASEQRVVIAPQDGYIAKAQARAGDLVSAGDLLASLDNQKLLLERQKWFSQSQQLRKKYRNALAGYDQAEAAILKSQIAQAVAQQQLVEEQLQRIQMNAPFAGLIISGDLSQSLGAPVERGDILFTVAPLDAYRLILHVDEQDIGYIQTGQQGELVLSGLVNMHFPFIVSNITPVSESRDGHNFFRVEAKLQTKQDLLRPGMEGIAKVNIDQRKTLWIWSRHLLNWCRLQLWTWMP